MFIVGGDCSETNEKNFQTKLQGLLQIKIASLSDQSKITLSKVTTSSETEI